MARREFELFRKVERQVCQSQIIRIFKDVDDFLKTAKSIDGRRKSRAGRSLENHMATILTDAGVRFDPRPRIDGKVEPDILIPGKKEYEDKNYPTDRLCVIGVKRTCKDRWRQVLSEADRIPQKHILTLQKGISPNQLKEMTEKHVTLIVPKSLHETYPAPEKRSGMSILTVDEFVKSIKLRLDGKAPPTLFTS